MICQANQLIWFYLLRKQVKTVFRPAHRKVRGIFYVMLQWGRLIACFTPADEDRPFGKASGSLIRAAIACIIVPLANARFMAQLQQPEDPKGFA